MTVHDVRHDTAGWGNHLRLTCYTEGCEGATLVAQSSMAQGRWDDLVAMFMAAHRATRLPCADRGGRAMTYDPETNTFTREAQ